MVTYTEYAAADYQARLAAEAAAEQAARDNLVARARSEALPLFTDHTGKVVLDPLTKTIADLADVPNGLVVLHPDDGSVPMVHFAVYPDRMPAELFIATADGNGGWTRGPAVADLDDVGEYLATGSVA